ncbi:hypothetical protein BpHYR1_020771 [Brachionus plicatilis]|uniref:Uncharacterized protein n=1 Tax=Brachionus plicatilis TaxID=10195 RepID=A0A3M7RAB0_BRAPC|nr:hypothetical protein BpHYR1_020771 [Brachionus plicatilis]
MSASPLSTRIERDILITFFAKRLARSISINSSSDGASSLSSSSSSSSLLLYAIIDSAVTIRVGDDSCFHSQNFDITKVSNQDNNKLKIQFSCKNFGSNFNFSDFDLDKTPKIASWNGNSVQNEEDSFQNNLVLKFLSWNKKINSQQLLHICENKQLFK